ncbi:hypothetical protein HispidOSU_010743, partial [Sigmodon hispidus]
HGMLDMRNRQTEESLTGLRTWQPWNAGGEEHTDGSEPHWTPHLAAMECW